jgi:hypothetical protein
MAEEFRPINNYPNYSVSNLGNVRSNENDRILRLSTNQKGYLKVNLYNDSGPKTKEVHKLVGDTFLANPDGLPEIDHINRIKTDNRLENLRFASCSENSKNRYKSTSGNVIYELLDELPNDCFIVPNYGNHEFVDLHYSPTTERFYKFTGVEFRSLPILEPSNRPGLLFVNVVDVANQKTLIYINKFKRLYNLV